MNGAGLNDGRSQLISFVKNFRCALCTVAFPETGPDLTLQEVPEELDDDSPFGGLGRPRMEAGTVNEPDRTEHAYQITH